MKELVPITIIYVIMFITGVLGNLAVCFVIIRNRSMHTATNYYLFSLAVSDLVILLLGKKTLFDLGLGVGHSISLMPSHISGVWKLI